MAMATKRRTQLSSWRKARPANFALIFLTALFAVSTVSFVIAIVNSAQKKTGSNFQPVILRSEPSATEAKLAAAKIEAAQQALYTARFGRGVRIDVPTNTPIYAVNPSGGSVTVRCASTQFGQVAIIGNAESTAFYKAGFIGGCVAGTVEAGTLIGRTIGNLQWSEHNPGGSVEPTLEPLELALLGTQPPEQSALLSTLPQALAIQVSQNFQH